MKNVFLDKKPSDDKRLFWEKVIIQLSDPTAPYSTIVDIRDSLIYDSNKLDFIMNFLLENVAIKEGLVVQNRFECLSETAQFNLISLFCLINYPIPDALLINETLQFLAQSYNEPPKMKISFGNSSPKHFEPEITQKEEKETEEINEEPPPIEAHSMTTEFFVELENYLVKYPMYQEALISQYLQSSDARKFYDTCTLFFSSDRAHEAIVAFVRYYVLTYIKNLNKLANRIIFTPLISFAQNNPGIFVAEVFQPLFFDKNSGVNQFQFMQRIFSEKNVQSITLSHLFDGHPPSLEGPLSDDAIKFLASIIPKSPQFEDDIVEHILLHIKTQMEYQKKDIDKCLLLILKSQQINGTNRTIVEELIDSLPEILKPKAIEMLEK